MAERVENFMVQLLQAHAKYDDPAWGQFILSEAKNLEETRELYFKTREELDKARVDASQLQAYIEVLERQLSLAQKLIEQRQNERFPIYKKRGGGIYGRKKNVHKKDYR